MHMYFFSLGKKLTETETDDILDKRLTENYPNRKKL